jgi:hypothetical protein
LTTTPVLDTGNISGYDQFVSALVSTILPALVERPRAMLEWLGLAKSVANLTAHRGWAAALIYLNTQLSDKVANRLPFGAYDDEILQGVHVASHAPAHAHPTSHAQHSGHSHAQPQHPAVPAAAPASHSSDANPDACRNWNFVSCRATACQRKHECMWLACKSKGENHIGKDCKHNPRLTAPAAGAPRGGRGAMRKH